MNVLQISADRSKRGLLFPGTIASVRQQAYAKRLGTLTIVAFSRRSDGATKYILGSLAVYPTNSRSRWLYLFDALRVAKSLTKPDVVSAQDPFETGFAALLIARAFRVPLHVQVHTDFLAPAYARHSLGNRIRIRIGLFVLARASGVRTVSENIRTSLMSRCHLDMQSVSVLPIFVDTQGFAGATEDTALAARFSAFKTKLLVVARLEPEKNVALALRAFKDAAPQDACLLIVGDGTERSRLETLARTLGIEHRVFFEGERDAVPYYKAADLALVTSRFEGYGLVIIEALASGTPVLSTDVGIAREAGAIVADERHFSEALRSWIAAGPREARLRAYPYADFDAYAEAYAADVAACGRS